MWYNIYNIYDDVSYIGAWEKKKEEDKLKTCKLD
jgi:hypothetical protein